VFGARPERYRRGAGLTADLRGGATEGDAGEALLHVAARTRGEPVMVILRSGPVTARGRCFDVEAVA
jgi:hypothetical protein